MKTYDYLH